MKKTTVGILEYINRYGLDFSMWNVEKNEVSCSHYGKNLSDEVTMKPHIALYNVEELPDDFCEKCDYTLESDELGTIYIYEMD